MKNKFLVLLIVTLCLANTSCNKDDKPEGDHYKISLRPNSTDGIDALINDLKPDINAGTHPDFIANAWTNQSIPVIQRSLVKFDLGEIPSNAVIDSAKLSLYSYISPANGAHSTLSGSNSCIIQRVNSFWDENTITWNNQPSVTPEDKVEIPQSLNDVEHYLEIDVTDMTTEMVRNQAANFGFMLKLVTEEFYRRMTFASSDNSNPELHPKLDIYYTIY